tara:strand:+ start:26 stop:316 length:291 start_codon:yes stop_codon:yes gene_type:complete
MVFKKRKDVPFRYKKFGMITAKTKRSPKFNQYVTIKRLIELDKSDIKLKCKKCKFESKIDVVDLLINLNPNILVTDAVKLINFQCERCKGNKFIIA